MKKNSLIFERLAIGTAQFGMNYGVTNKIGEISKNDVEKIINCAYKAGINTLDTAVCYGSSEKKLGEIGIHNWKVITKLPKYPINQDFDENWVNLMVQSSLKKLKIKSCYGLLLHNSRDLLGKNGDKIFKSLKKIKDLGLIKKIGISIYNTYELDLIIPKYEIDLIQSPFNILDQRIKKSGWMDKLKNNNIELHARSVFLQGLLLQSKKDLPTKFKKWLNVWEKLEKYLISNSISSLTACLGFALNHKQFDNIVLGVDSLSQLKNILSFTDSPNTNEFNEFTIDDENLINPTKW